MQETKKQRLEELYKKWAAELEGVSFQCSRDSYSHPYYLHIPDNWCDAEIRILVVGEEGYGQNIWNTSLEEAQAFNRDYLRSQLGLPVLTQYGFSSSAFWNRIRRIYGALNNEKCAMTWTNLDKIHHSGRGCCKLSEKDRVALHATPTRILQEEIKILWPTHIIFFGWYGTSLQAELPEIHKRLYPKGAGDCSLWRNGRICSFQNDDIWYLFTYHPNWGQRQKKYDFMGGYEDYVFREFQKLLTKN